MNYKRRGKRVFITEKHKKCIKSSHHLIGDTAGSHIKPQASSGGSA